MKHNNTMHAKVIIYYKELGPGPEKTICDVDTGLDWLSFNDGEIDRESVRTVLYEAFTSESMHNRSEVEVRFCDECPECHKVSGHGIHRHGCKLA